MCIRDSVSNDKSSDKFFNDVIRGNVNGLKINADDKTELQGAVIGLFNADETDFSEENAIETVVSDDDGSFNFEEIIFGNYLVKEIESPTGYVLSDETFPVVISEDGDVIEITIKNEKIRGSVQVKKYDLTNKSKALNGAVFEIFADKNGNEKTLSVKNTNQYLAGNVAAPDRVTVIGGKTGTTSAAGNCLILLARDTSGNPYIAVILKSAERGILYTEMNALLKQATS